MNARTEKVEKALGNFTAVLTVSADLLSAHLEIKEKKQNVRVQESIPRIQDFPTVYEINEFLSENGVIYGVETNVLDYLVKNKVQKKTLIASGQKPISGINAKIEYKCDISRNIKLVQDDSGNIDFKNLNWLSQVRKNEIIAEKIPAGKGIDGIGVNGEVIPATEGKDINFKFGKNVTTSYDFMKMISMIDGMLDIKDDKVMVNEVLVINGDVDTSVGNINFIGDLLVMGDVKAGYKIKVDGSMQVNGVVEASEINVGKDLIVKGGIQGSETSKIYVDGSVLCKFIENANVHCYGDISTEFIIHSNVRSGKSIMITGTRGMIVGGEVIAKNSIEANLVGSNMGTKTSIVLGADLDRDNLLEEKRLLSAECNVKLKKLTPIIEMGKKMLSLGTMDNIRKISFAKSLKEYNDVAKELGTLTDEIKKLEEQVDESRGSYLLVNQKIYPGVKVSIIDSCRYIKDFTNRCKICLKDNEIALEAN